MISIKNSFSNCSRCDLLENHSCILETNCKTDLKKVDVVFVAENPGKEEVKKGKLLVGKSGKKFRQYFERFEIDKMNYLLTNVVLCQTLNDDGTTGNPTEETIELCKDNCMEIIKACEPKLVVLMGTIPMAAFGIAKAGITNIHERYELFDWEGFKTMVIVHPSFVNRNPSWEAKFSEGMSRIAEILSGKHIETVTKSQIKSLGKGIFRYSIPEEFYTDDYRLIDVQYLNRTSQILYIFRDKDNKKVFHKENDDHVCYQAPKGVEARKIVPYDKLKQIVVKYKDRYNLDPNITYEGDVRLASKHAMDYYYKNQGECPKTTSNIMFFDIEVDTGDQRVFPKPEDASFPINLITTIYNGNTICYGVDNKTEEIKRLPNVTYKIFKNEKQLMRSFIDDYKKTDPDFISGWNSISFDLAYIYNRLPQIGILQTSMNKFGEFYVEGNKFVCHLPGTVPVDQYFLYRTFTFTNMSNYKLGFIAQHELGITKIDLPLPFNEMYWKMQSLTYEYNVRDSELLEKLDDKLGHINLLNELRIICNTNFEATSSFGQIDSLMVSFLRNKEIGMASKNSDPHILKESYPGAYVHPPIPGVYDWITDFDFTSLYPSLMITYNIGINSFVMKTKDPEIGYDLVYDKKNVPKEVEMVIDPLFKAQTVKMSYEKLCENIEKHKLVHTINGCFFQPHKKELSVFGEVVDMLMVSRKEYKRKMFDAIEKKNKDLEKFYYTRQLVYKVLANTLYGVVANKAFRFFNLSLASAITLGGQEAIKTSIVEGDAYMRHLNTGSPYVSPPQLTKREMFEGQMPDRGNEYIVTGDTDSIFCCFEKFGDVSVDNIRKLCKKVEVFLNEDKILNVVKNHNCDLDYNRMNLKNELVISRGLFLAKKRYAIRVINNEGKDVDKINYMGVEIKRSDYPSKSKEFLTTLTEMILKSDKVSLPQLMKFVSRQENEFLEAIYNGEKVIAKPVSYGKEISDYKNVPQGVRAMEAWNQIMYDVHKPGMRAYMFWVQGLDLEKAPKDVRERYHQYIKDGNHLEVIAIPDEEKRLPDYFIPNKQAALKFTFIDRYRLMLQPFEFQVQKQEVLTF